MKISKIENRKLLSEIIGQSKRFFSHVEISSSCWIWKGGIDKDGYGVFMLNFITKGERTKQLKIRAHRFSLMFHKKIIERKLLVIHSCDNPPCCNPEHLEFATQSKNRADAVLRGRVAKGERVNTSKLKEEDAIQIIWLKKCGASLRELSERFGVNKSSIWAVGNTSWKHLSERTKNESN